MATVMKLNLGSGYKRYPGFHNVDADRRCHPDTVHDLEQTPWPFATDSVDEILASHVFEHLGPTPKIWMAIWLELYRICKDGAVIHVKVPHPRHDTFLIDPTHVRPVFPETVAMFDQARNQKTVDNKGEETTLGLIYNIDLEVFDVDYQVREPWLSRLKSGQVSGADFENNVRHLANVCEEIQFKVRIIKPQRFAHKLEKETTL
jgi:hypothetical protein